MRTKKTPFRRNTGLALLTVVIFSTAGWLLPELFEQPPPFGAPQPESTNPDVQDAQPRFAPVSTPDIQRLRRAINSELRALPASSKFSVAVRGAGEARQLLFEQNATTALVPASNMKLFTAAAALSLLGPDHEFATRFLANGTYRGGVLDGDLIIMGCGDPTISKRFLETDDPMIPMVGLARLLKKSGLREVTGDVIGWTGALGGPSKPARWPNDPLWKWWMVEVTPLAFNDNQVDIRSFVADGRPRIEAIPNIGHVTFTNKLALCDKSKSMAVSFQRPAESSHFTVIGRLYKKTSGYIQGANVHDGSLYFTRALHRAAQTVGITIKGRPRTSSVPDRATLSPLSEVYTYRSRLMDSLPIMLKKSQNLYAELIHRAVGGSATAEGVSFETATATVLNWLRSNDCLEPSTRLADGSGLSRANQVSARQVNRLLHFMAKDPALLHIYRNSLAEPGAYGTLRKRMPSLNGRIFAKTGTLNSIKALSGYAVAADGRHLTFSLLFNNTNTALARRIQDRICAHIVQVGQ